MAETLRLRLDLENDSDSEEQDELTRGLRDELLQLDVTDVKRPAGAAPEGARAIDAVALGTLLVTLSGDTLGVVAKTIQRWISRAGSRTVSMEIDGDKIDLKGVSAEDQQKLIEAFVARHAEG